MRNHSYYDAIRRRRQYEEQLRDNGESSKNLISKIAAHPETSVITRDSMPDPWVFVENLFPRIAKVISETKVFKNENTAFLRNLELPEAAGGLFFPKASTILVCWNHDKFPDHVIICHEMLHYADQLLGGKMVSRDADENFAYYNSIQYLHLHDLSASWIAEEYMLPYYWGLEIEKIKRQKTEVPSEAEIENAKKDAIAKCMAAIEQQLFNRQPEEDPTEDLDRFDLI